MLLVIMLFWSTNLGHIAETNGVIIKKKAHSFGNSSNSCNHFSCWLQNIAYGYLMQVGIDQVMNEFYPLLSPNLQGQPNRL